MGRWARRISSRFHLHSRNKSRYFIHKQWWKCHLVQQSNSSVITILPGYVTYIHIQSSFFSSFSCSRNSDSEKGKKGSDPANFLFCQRKSCPYIYIYFILSRTHIYIVTSKLVKKYIEITCIITGLERIVVQVVFVFKRKGYVSNRIFVICPCVLEGWVYDEIMQDLI
jgi:hypothetical protein